MLGAFGSSLDDDDSIPLPLDDEFEIETMEIYEEKTFMYKFVLWVITHPGQVSILQTKVKPRTRHLAVILTSSACYCLPNG